MNDLWVVLRDLYAFAKDALFPSGAVNARETPLLPKPASQVQLPAPVPSVTLPEAQTHIPQDVLGLTGTGYVATTEAMLLPRPVLAFDTPRQELRYGTTVSIMGYQGRFVHVSTSIGTGWVRKDDITTDKAAVWPILAHGHTYLASDTETELIRRHLTDEFFTADLFLPLSTEEYVVYRLLQVGRTLNWGEDRPRPAGRWHELLRGRRGIFTSIEPKTGAVMEAYPESREPFVAYVTKVTPEQSIEIEAVGQETDGEYRTTLLSREEWLAWRPVFIQVT